MGSSIVYGLKNTLRLWPLALLFWLVNAFIVWLMFQPMFHSLRAATQDSMIGERLDGGLANWHFIFEFLQREPTFFAAAFGTVLALSSVYFIVRFLMAGGVLAVVAGQCEGRFWQGVGRYASRNMRLALWALILLVMLLVVILMFQIGMALLLSATMGDEAGGVQSLFFSTGFAVVVLFCFRLVLDFARTYMVASDSRSAFFCLRKGVAFVFTRPVKTVGLAVFFGLLGLGVVVLATKLNPTFAATSLVAFLIHQGWLIVRAALRVGLFAGEYHLMSQQLAGQLAGSPDDEFTAQATTLSQHQRVQAGGAPSTATSMAAGDLDAPTASDNQLSKAAPAQAPSAPITPPLAQQRAAEVALDNQPDVQPAPHHPTSGSMASDNPMHVANEGEKPPRRRAGGESAGPAHHATSDPMNLTGQANKREDSLPGEADVIRRREEMHIGPDSDPLMLGGDNRRREPDDED